MVPESLKEKLQKASPEERPKVMYINPTGANPTGTVLPLDRRKQIYQTACEYDLLILEDDPYYYLQFTNGNRVPSFYSMDVEGRVLRFDSFSKILSSGLRLGLVTGPPTLIDRINLHMQVIAHSTHYLLAFF